MRPATRTLAACVVLSAVLGTIHAFSLFIDPFEEGLDAARGAVSSVYSLALVALTLAVLTGHPLFRRLPGPLVALGAAGGAAAGLLVASSAASIAVLIVGYGTDPSGGDYWHFFLSFYREFPLILWTFLDKSRYFPWNS